jgi:hypothetical protein
MNKMLTIILSLCCGVVTHAQNVGIGHPFPYAPLTIRHNAAYIFPNPGAGAVGGLNFNTTTDGQSTGITFSRFDGSDAQAGIYVEQNTSFGTKMYFATTDAYATGPQTKLTILHNGNIGVGIINPNYKLDVAGRMRIQAGADLSNAAGIWFNNMAQQETGFIGMKTATQIGLYGNNGAEWGLFMNTTDGSVIIGNGVTAASGFKLSIGGKAICEELKVQLKTNWPDFVFNENYELLHLTQVENFIRQNKHLPGMPSAAEIEKNNGFEIGDTQKKLLQKIEELQLYILQLNKRIGQLEKNNPSTLLP